MWFIKGCYIKFQGHLTSKHNSPFFIYMIYRPRNIIYRKVVKNNENYKKENMMEYLIENIFII